MRKGLGGRRPGNEATPRSHTGRGPHVFTSIRRGAPTSKGGGGRGKRVVPRRACAAKVTVLGLSVSVSVHDYSRTAGNEAASQRYQQLQRNKRSKIKMS